MPVVESKKNKTETNLTTIDELVAAVVQIRKEMARLIEYVGTIGQKLRVAVQWEGLVSSRVRSIGLKKLTISEVE